MKPSLAITAVWCAIALACKSSPTPPATTGSATVQNKPAPPPTATLIPHVYELQPANDASAAKVRLAIDLPPTWIESPDLAPQGGPEFTVPGPHPHTVWISAVTTPDGIPETRVAAAIKSQYEDAHITRETLSDHRVLVVQLIDNSAYMRIEVPVTGGVAVASTELRRATDEQKIAIRAAFETLRETRE